MKMEDLKFKVDYNFGANALVILASLSDFKEEGSVNFCLNRDYFLLDPAQSLSGALNSLVNKLREIYFPVASIAVGEINNEVSEPLDAA